MAFTTQTLRATGDLVTAVIWNLMVSSLNSLDPTNGATEGQVPKVNATLDGYDFGRAGMKRAINGGYYLIPAGPADGTTVASSASNDTYGSWVEMLAAAAADLYIVGVLIGQTAAASWQYIQVDIGVGAAASESSVGEVKSDSLSNVGTGRPIMLPAPIRVASGARVACRTADQGGGAGSHAITLICINAADLEDF